MSVRASMYFGVVELVGSYVLKLTQVLLFLMLWRMLFAQGVREEMTLEQMQRYVLLSSVFAPLLDVRTPASDWLHDGTMMSLYGRPLGIFGQLTAHTLGQAFLPMCIFTPLALLIAWALGISLMPASPWFWLSLPLATAQGFAVDYLFACLIIRTGNLSWTILSFRNALTVLLTGALIPFSALPFGLGDILILSPLGTLAGASLAIATGLSKPGVLVPVQILWNVTLWPLALYCFRRSKERMVSYGG